MNTYNEGLIAIFICFTILIIAIIGIALYYIHERTKSNREETIQLRILVESLIEIFTNGDKKEDESENRSSRK